MFVVRSSLEFVQLHLLCKRTECVCTEGERLAVVFIFLLVLEAIGQREKMGAVGEPRKDFRVFCFLVSVITFFGIMVSCTVYTIVSVICLGEGFARLKNDQRKGKKIKHKKGSHDERTDGKVCVCVCTVKW